MRAYGRLSPQFWIGHTGRAIRKLGQEAQVVALYLLSSPHATMLGLYYLPITHLAHETGIPIEAASKALQGLIGVGFCDYDNEAEVVWVKEMARFQIGEQLDAADKRCKGIAKEYASLPSNRFLGAFFDRYAGAFNLPARRGDYDGDKQAPSKPISSPSEAPSEPHRSQEQEQDQDQDFPAPSLRSGAGIAGAATSSPARLPKIPDCPHEEIISLFHEILPMCQQVRRWRGRREELLRARWREEAQPEKVTRINGYSGGYSTAEEGLGWWRLFFEHVAKSRFLTGRTAGREGRPRFVATLPWLVKPENFTKVIEGNYDD